MDVERFNFFNCKFTISHTIPIVFSNPSPLISPIGSKEGDGLEMWRGMGFLLV